jgi:asparagine synthetase B (glutamine-hydrolysing)
MCGISGLIMPPEKIDQLRFIKPMTDLLINRGPDAGSLLAKG